jgi:hypothetical protein
MWGYINTSGKLAIPAQFQKAVNFRDGLAAVSINGRWGFIDPIGKLVIPVKYERIYDFFEGISAATEGNSLGYLDKAAEELCVTEHHQRLPGPQMRTPLCQDPMQSSACQITADGRCS